MTVDLFSVGIRPAAGILLAIPYSARVDVALGGIVAAAMVVVFLAGWRLTRAMWRTTKAMRLRQRREIVRLAQGGEPVAESSQAAVVRAYAEARLRWSDSWPYRAFIRVLYPMWMALSFAYPSAVNASYGHVGRAVGGAAFILVCAVPLVYEVRSNRRFRRTAAINGWSTTGRSEESVRQTPDS
jgi:hypothetical protein